MTNEFNFNGLFVFDMANNHQGNVKHGLRIIRDVAKIAHSAGVRGGIKFQFRNLDILIHPDHKTNSGNKHIPRFISTALSQQEYAVLVAEVRKQKMIPLCTPFDEESVDHILAQNIDVIKIASCSATDWPLLEKIADAGKPVICSTGGLTVKEIDNIVSFFQHRGVHFALMHCIAIYPTPNEKLQLDRIELLNNRYPQVTIGFSTHEEPDNTDAVKIAFAKGARIFERHVGITTDKIKLNAYSSTPEQLATWLKSYKTAVHICGIEGAVSLDTSEERASLKTLMRGAYANRALKKGVTLKRNDVFFAMPLLGNQLESGRWNENLVTDREYRKNEPIDDKLSLRKPTRKEIIYTTIHEVKAMLNMARIAVGNEFSVELSHHYGLENFQATGATIIDCINRAYCKKLIIQLPGQAHPNHYHAKKEETFQILYGEVDVEIEGHAKRMFPGETVTIQPGVWHTFKTTPGVIFEEVSTTHFNDDSFYEDKSISKLQREERKTKLINWGRHQFD